MKKRYMPSILIVLCLLIAACIGAAYAKYASVEKAENLFFLSSDVKKSEAYAAYSDTTKTLYFLNDILIKAGETIPGTNDTATTVYTDILGNEFDGSVHDWLEHDESIETVRFLGSIIPKDIQGWFMGCTKLENIYGMAEHLNTYYVVNMIDTFAGCVSLTELDLSGFNTASVTSINCMFSGCSNLVTIYASENFVINPKIIGFEGTLDMFKGCINLVGGNNTPFDDTKTNHAYAKIDKGDSQPGYFTLKDSTTQSPATLNVVVDSSVAAGCTVPTWNYQNKDTVITLTTPVEGMTEVVLTCGEQTATATVTDGTITIPAEFVTNGATITIGAPTE